MSDLREAIEALTTLGDALGRGPATPREDKRPTLKAMLAVTRGADLPAATPPTDRLEVVWRTIVELRKRGGSFSTLSPQDLRDALWLLWDPRRKGAEIAELLAVLLDRCDVRSSMLRRMVHVWLGGFDLRFSTISIVGHRIALALRAHQHGPLSRWRETHDRYRFFEASSGPRQVARDILEQSSCEPLKKIGLDTPLRLRSGYMRAVSEEFGNSLPNFLRGPKAAEIWECTVAFYVPDGTLRFDEPRACGSMANAIVAPWVAGRANDAIRSDVLTFLRHHLHDPRTDPSRWSQASPDTLKTVRAWLAQLTLDAFFDVIGRYARKAGFDATWQERKKFWSACLRKGWVTDSWLALGPNAYGNVAINRDLRGSYGRLVNGKTKDHSALLIRIGKLVFVEWSHNGKLYAWRADSGRAPPLAPTPTYGASDLEGICLAFPAPDDRPDLAGSDDHGLIHHRGTWQGRVAALLRNQTGLRLERRDWEHE